MRRLKRTHLILLSLALILIIAPIWLSASRQRQPRFALAHTEAHTIDWSTVDGGGGSSSSGAYSLSGTIGQYDAGPPQGMSSGSYYLHGGFWPGAAPAYQHYLPIINH